MPRRSYHGGAGEAQCERNVKTVSNAQHFAGINHNSWLNIAQNPRSFHCNKTIMTVFHQPVTEMQIGDLPVSVDRL